MFLSRACDLGYAPSCLNLSVMYGKGDGVPLSDLKSKQYFNRTVDLVEKQTRTVVGQRFKVPPLPAPNLQE